MNTYTVTDATTPQQRYTTADFHRLTNNRLQPPHTPYFYCPAGIDLGHAERTNARDTGRTGDKRLSPSRRVTVSDAQGRRSSTITRQTSFSSIKEDAGGEQLFYQSQPANSSSSHTNAIIMRPGIAQSFLESPIHHTASQPASGQEPDSQLDAKDSCICSCRCGRARERRIDGARGKRRSRSYSPLRTSVSELTGWTLETQSTNTTAEGEERRKNRPGEAALERLPAEILDNVISQLALDIPPAEYTPRNEDVVHCLLTSRTMYAATITTLYSHITIPHSNVFAKFLHHISESPARGTIVRRLDMSHFTPVGMGRTHLATQNIQNLTPTTLLQCLELTPNIQEVLLQEHVDDDLSDGVLRKLFYGLSNLRALDLCASSSAKFVDAFSATVSDLELSDAPMLSIRKLSLHECFTIKKESLETLLPRLPRLTHLDLFHTRVNDKALMSIARTARLTHLNLGRCSQLTGAGVVDFLTTHPAAAGLVYLNLSCDLARFRLFVEADVDRLLPSLPSTLRSLNLRGAQIRSRHTDLLLPLTKHLEELGIGYTDLSMRDVNSLFVPSCPHGGDELVSEEEANWVPSTLRYMDMTGMAAITQPALVSNACVLLSSVTSPLEVIELGDKPIAALKECAKTNKRFGWVVKELGRRGWYVREPTKDAEPDLIGRRSWKMGAMWWGMRKIPVAYGEVGGLYGHYMFKK